MCADIAKINPSVKISRKDFLRHNVDYLSTFPFIIYDIEPGQIK